MRTNQKRPSLPGRTPECGSLGIRILYRSNSRQEDFESVLRKFAAEISWHPTLNEIEIDMRQSTGGVLSIIFAIEADKPALLKHLREVERFTNTQCHCAVRTLVLLLDFAPPELVHELQRFGAEALSLKPIHSIEEQFVQLLVWQLVNRRRLLPLFKKMHSGTETSIWLVGRLEEVALPYQGRLLDLFETLDHHWRPKKYLVEQTNIPLSEINIYIKRLRDIFNARRQDAGVTTWGKNVFQAKKVGGLWLYRLAAEII